MAEVLYQQRAFVTYQKKQSIDEKNLFCHESDVCEAVMRCFHQVMEQARHGNWENRLNAIIQSTKPGSRNQTDSTIWNFADTMFEKPRTQSASESTRGKSAQG